MLYICMYIYTLCVFISLFWPDCLNWPFYQVNKMAARSHFTVNQIRSAQGDETSYTKIIITLVLVHLHLVVLSKTFSL